MLFIIFTMEKQTAIFNNLSAAPALHQATHNSVVQKYVEKITISVIH